MERHRNCTFLQNFQTWKLGEITVLYAVGASRIIGLKKHKQFRWGNWFYAEHLDNTLVVNVGKRTVDTLSGDSMQVTLKEQGKIWMLRGLVLYGYGLFQVVAFLGHAKRKTESFLKKLYLLNLLANFDPSNSLAVVTLVTLDWLDCWRCFFTIIVKRIVRPKK